MSASDRELLFLAAHAAITDPVLCYESSRNCLRIGDRSSYVRWRPLTHDGDAFRLAIELKITVMMDDMYVFACRGNDYEQGMCEAWGGASPESIVRRAIVRMAAVIGKEKQEQSQ